MQNLLRNRFRDHRTVRWGDVDSVRSSALANYSRLTGLPPESLAVALPFWEDKVSNIQNYGMAEKFPVTISNPDLYEMTPKGLKILPNISGNISVSGLNARKLAGVFIGLYIEDYNYLTLYKTDDGSNIRKFRGTAGSYGTGGSVNYYFHLEYTLSSAVVVSVQSDNELYNQNATTSCSFVDFQANQRFDIKKRSLGKSRTYDIVAPTSGYSMQLCLDNNAITGYLPAYCGMCILIDLDELSYLEGVKATQILSQRGWELFQPTYLTSLYMGATEVADVQITIDPNADNALSFTGFSELAYKLLQGINVSPDALDGEGSIVGSGFQSISLAATAFEAVGSIEGTGLGGTGVVFAATVNEAVSSITHDLIHGAFIDRVQEAVGSITGQHIISVLADGLVSGVSAITHHVGCGRIINSTPLESVGSIAGGFFTSAFQTATPLEAATFSAGEFIISVNVSVESDLTAIGDNVFEFAQGGNCIHEWVVSSAEGSISGQFITSVHKLGTFEGDSTITAEALGEKSLEIANMLFTNLTSIYGDVFVANLPVSGEFRNTDLINFNYQTSLVSLRRG